MGFAWCNTEKYQTAGRSDAGGCEDLIAKRVLVPDHVIGRHDGKYGVGVLSGCNQSCSSDRRGGVARRWFQDYRMRLDPGGFQFLLDEEAVIIVARYDRSPEARGRRQAAQGSAEETRLLIIEEPDELFGIHGSGTWPQAGTGTTRQNYWRDGR